MWFRSFFAVVLSIAACGASEPARGSEDELRRGLLALSRNDLSVARESLQAASKLSPENPLVWAALAQALIRSGDTKAAGGAAQQAAKLGPDNPVIQHALAMYYSEAADFPAAAEWERRFASSKGADLEAASRAAMLSMQAGDLPQTIAWAKLALAKHDTADLHYLLGRAYRDSKQPDLAIQEFRAAVTSKPKTEAFAFDLGRTELQQGNFAAALRTFGDAREHFPDSAQIQLAYGVSAYGQRRFTEAIDAFLRVTRIDPAVEQPYVFLARILDQAGDRMPEIVAAYAAWTRAAPENYLAWCLHAKALSASSPDGAAIESELRGSIRLNDRFWESHFELGVLLAKRRQWQEAAAELSRSIELNPHNAVAHFQLARVYDRLGRPEQARAERAEHARLTAGETGTNQPGAKDVLLH